MVRIARFPGGLALDVIPYLGQHFHRIQVSKPVKSHTKSVSSTVTTLENYSFSSAGFEPTSSARKPESKTTMLFRHSIQFNSVYYLLKTECLSSIVVLLSGSHAEDMGSNPAAENE